MKRGLRCKIIRVVKTPYHLQDVGSRKYIYICKDKHQPKMVEWASMPPSCNFNSLKTGATGAQGQCVRLDGAPFHLNHVRPARAAAGGLTPMAGRAAWGEGRAAPAAPGTDWSPEADAARLTASSRPQALRGRPGAPSPPASPPTPAAPGRTAGPGAAHTPAQCASLAKPRGNPRGEAGTAAPGREGHVPLGTPSRAGGPGTYPRPGGRLEERERTWRRRSPQAAMRGVS